MVINDRSIDLTQNGDFSSLRLEGRGRSSLFDILNDSRKIPVAPNYKGVVKLESDRDLMRAPSLSTHPHLFTIGDKDSFRYNDYFEEMESVHCERCGGWIPPWAVSALCDECKLAMEQRYGNTANPWVRVFENEQSDRMSTFAQELNPQRTRTFDWELIP